MTSDIFAGVDEAEMKQKLPSLLGQNNMGDEFWFSVPPVYEEVPGYNFVRVYVTSAVETDVVLEIEGKGIYVKKKTIANGVIDFELNPSHVQPTKHRFGTNISPPAKVYEGIGVNVRADAPIVVYVVVKFRYTSDGFLALPVSSMGDSYINMVYQDPALGNENSHSPAFTCVIGAFDDTEIDMTMGGGPLGTDVMVLEGGQKLNTGEKTTFTLDKGDVWMGASNGHFQDISGSLFKGNKPFAIVSGMHCANFPVGNPWCDYTVEMEMPTHIWGKQYYVTPMEDRAFNGIVRVFAAEPGTNVYRDDVKIGNLTHGGGNTFGKAYMEFRLWPKYDNNGDTIPPKLATIHADKPIAVMYYNTGSQEDDMGSDSDPFQMLITPIEQYQNHIIFPSPNAKSGNDKFVNNYINVNFEMHNDSIPGDLLYAEIEDGITPNWQHISNFIIGDVKVFAKEYNNKKYGSVTVKLPTEGVFSLKSDSTEFAAYSYGFSPYESYGFPTSSATKDITVIDTDAPEPTYAEDENEDQPGFTGMVTDMPDESHSRVNISDLYLIDNLNGNFEFEYKNPSNNRSEFIPGKQRELSWTLSVKNKEDSASATIYFLDRAGNDTTITLSYSPKIMKEPDTSKPAVTYTQENCDGSIAKGNGSVTDMPNDDDIRSNIESITLIENLNDNYNLEYSIPGSDEKEFVPGEHRTLDWWLSVVDENEPASATIMFKDRAGNDTTITVDYNPPLFHIGSSYAEPVDVGANPVLISDTIRNLSSENGLYITRVELKDGDQGFSIVGYQPEGWKPGMPIAEGSEAVVNLQFDPTNANADVTYSDSLGIGYGDENFVECDFVYLAENKIDTRTTSVEQLPSSQYSLYPNPTKNSITISVEEGNLIANYTIYDMDGNTLLSAKGDNTAKQTINLESLPVGIYLIELITDENKYIRDKFIKE